MEEPVFEIRHPDGRAIKIYASGRATGAPDGFEIIMNRIPAHAAYALRRALETSNDR